MGSVSKKGIENIVVWALFNKRQRNFRRRPQKRNRQHHTTRTELQHRLLHLVNYRNNPGLVHELTTLAFRLLQRKLGILVDLANNHLLGQTIPKYIALIIKDLASFRLGIHKINEPSKTNDTAKTF